MLNIDPLLFQPKVIRMSTTSSIGLPGQHIIRTTEFSNSQVMTGTAAQIHNEANNNILNTNSIDTAGEFASRGRDFGNISGGRDLRNFNEMELDQDSGERDIDAPHPEWSAEMYWSGEGDISDNSTLERISHQNLTSTMSFQSNLSSSTASASFHSQLSEQSESKEEIISSMLVKVRSHNKVEASKILLAMSNSVENCLAMRQCGVLPLLIQLLHSPESENSNTYHLMHAKRVNFEIRERASQVLHNIVFSQPDDKKGRREARVLRLLEQIRDYCDQLRNLDTMDVDDNRNARCVDQHLGPAVAALMKLSFDEDHRYAMCQLGGLQAIAELLQIDHEVHGCTSDQYCITIRRYSGMALTNLTFGDGANKALLCSMRPFMEALVAQLYSPSEDLRQVTASVLRNLSWRADPASKRMLRDVGAVTILVKAAMEAEKESTLKSILSALWNLSAHCSANKADICLVDGALAFLVGTLTYKSKSKTLAIVENGGGILRNVSSHIAIQNDYRVILRKHNCLQILLQHLKSPSLTVVSNACGTLWNLSARNAVDQRALWEMGAVGMLKKLINSKHKMISMGSSAALKNLLSAKPPGVALGLCVHNGVYGGGMPSLHIRKEKALSTEIDQNLAETYDNTDSPKTSPSHQATSDKGGRIARRHISPSARYMTTAQKQRNDLLSLQNHQEEKLTYVVEEKHNGAFQVTKSAKQVMNYRQGGAGGVPQSHRLSLELKESVEDSPKDSCGILDRNYFVHQDHKQQQSRTESPQVVDMGVKKDYRGSDRVTNVAQKSMNHQMVSSSPKHHFAAETGSGIPKPVHESRIPLPKSCSGKQLDATSSRSQSASPVPQRRAAGIPQRQDNNTSLRHMDVVTHPKHAWPTANNCSFGTEKEDDEPERPVVNLAKMAPIRPQNARPDPTGHLISAGVPHRVLVDDYSYGSEDEVKVYQTENTPLNYSLNSSVNDLMQEAGAASGVNRCSLNIKTCTNVKLMKNHPLLANVGNNRVEEDSSRLFEFRHGSRDYRNFEGGKTVDFSVQSDYDIDENLSMMSRSSSVASISSFDQQSFHDDESFASDLSHHTSGIESLGELSDNSPCQTVPSSPQKAVRTGSDSSDAQQMMKSSAVDGAPTSEQLLRGSLTPDPDDREPLTSDSADGSTLYQNAETGMEDEFEVQEGTMVQASIEPESSSLKLVARSSGMQVKDGFEESETDVLATRLADDDSSRRSAGGNIISKATRPSVVLDIEDRQKVIEELSTTSESADFVTCASELGSCSSVEGETMDDISPIERAMLEKCIRAGMPQKNSDQGVRQKVPKPGGYQLTTASEKHPKACGGFDRGSSLKSLDLKDPNEYESHSENEEKGKEDERKAEKKRLFRILESPAVDDRKVHHLDSNKSDYHSPSSEEKKDSTSNGNIYDGAKILVDQKGNRRSEKHSEKNGSRTRQGAESVSSQLDFLMTNKKAVSSAGKSEQTANEPKFQDVRNEARKPDDRMGKEIESANVEMAVRPVPSQLDFLMTNKPGKSEQNDRPQTTDGHKVQDTRNEARSREVQREEVKSTNEEVQSTTVTAGEESQARREEKFEKDIDCCEKENSGDSEESVMMSSSLLCEAREIAEALLGARMEGSTEDMTVSTLSCLSDIDNARPPSVMGDMGSLSMTNSAVSEENLKVAVTKECQKLLGKAYSKQMPPSTSKKSLLRELQIVRLNSEHGDFSKGSSNDSPENLSVKSSSSDVLLGNVNPPSVLDEMSLTASSTGSLIGDASECDMSEKVVGYGSVTSGQAGGNTTTLSERMNDAAAMAQLYAKELSNITGNNNNREPGDEAPSRCIRTQESAHGQHQEVTIADVTEIGCDTIGSDTELEDDLPCDDEEDPGSDTLQAPSLNYRNSRKEQEEDHHHGDGSTENLTLTLTEEPPRDVSSPYFDFGNQNGCFMTADEFRALQENADMILNTLREAEISDDEEEDEERCCMSNGDMLDDETMSLVSNESDEEFLSPVSGNHHHLQKHSPKGGEGFPASSQVCNGMIALPQSCSVAPPKSSRKTSLPQVSSARNKSTIGSIIPKPEDRSTPNRNRYSYPSGQIPTSSLSESPKKNVKNHSENSTFTRMKPAFEQRSPDVETHPGGFDSRTFTRKKSTVPRGIMVPSVHSGSVPSLRSPSSQNVPSLPGNAEVVASNINIRSSEQPPRAVASKIAAVWKTGKVRSKSMVDPNRNSKFRLEKSASTGSAKDEKIGVHQSERSPSQTPSPQSPLSRSSTYEKLNDAEDEFSSSSQQRRPSTLPISQKMVAVSPRHARIPPPTTQQRLSQRQQDGISRGGRTIPTKTDILSPTSHQNSTNSNIPKFQNKAQQPSLIPNRRSMIPTPAKFELPD